MDVTLFREQVTLLGKRLRQESQNHPETWTQMLVLGAIDRLRDDATPSKIAAAESMRSSNLAAALRELEELGYIARTPDDVDRRKTRLTITSAGRDALHLSRRLRDHWLLEAFSGCLTEAEKHHLKVAGPLLEKLARYKAG